MNYCPYCQATLLPQDKFCTKCGSQIPIGQPAPSYAYPTSQPKRALHPALIAITIVIVAAIIGTVIFFYPTVQAHIPGPNGAPSDSSSFKISVVFTGTDLATGDPNTSSATITVTGNPDTASGSVCGQHQDGLPFVTHNTFGAGSLAGTPYTETLVATCTGTYKGGKLEEDITATSHYLSYTNPSTYNPMVCSAPVPYVAGHIQGIFGTATEISGNYSFAGTKFSCSLLVSIPQYAEAGTWNGSVISE